MLHSSTPLTPLLLTTLTLLHTTPHHTNPLLSTQFSPLHFNSHHSKQLCVPSTRTVSHDRWVVYYIKRFQHNYNLMTQLNKKLFSELTRFIHVQKFKLSKFHFSWFTRCTYDRFLKRKITTENLMNRCEDQNEWRGVFKTRLLTISAFNIPELRLNFCDLFWADLSRNKTNYRREDEVFKRENKTDFKPGEWYKFNN